MLRSHIACGLTTSQTVMISVVRETGREREDEDCCSAASIDWLRREALSEPQKGSEAKNAGDRSREGEQRSWRGEEVTDGGGGGRLLRTQDERVELHRPQRFTLELVLACSNRTSCVLIEFQFSLSCLLNFIFKQLYVLSRCKKQSAAREVLFRAVTCLRPTVHVMLIVP